MRDSGICIDCGRDAMIEVNGIWYCETDLNRRLAETRVLVDANGVNGLVAASRVREIFAALDAARIVCATPAHARLVVEAVEMLGALAGDFDATSVLGAVRVANLRQAARALLARIDQEG